MCWSFCLKCALYRPVPWGLVPHLSNPFLSIPSNVTSTISPNLNWVLRCFLSWHLTQFVFMYVVTKLLLFYFFKEGAGHSGPCGDQTVNLGVISTTLYEIIFLNVFFPRLRFLRVGTICPQFRFFFDVWCTAVAQSLFAK